MTPAPAPAAARRAVVVDDEVALATLVGGYLERDGFAVTLCHDGAQAVDVVREVRPDVVVLDLGLPGVDGVEVCRRLRTFTDCYVVMLTARAEEVDTLIGLSVGADDYVTKPFSPRELMARVGVLLRRPRQSTAVPPAGPPPLQVGALRVDVGARETHLDGRRVELTRTEFDILAALASRPGVVLSRRALIDAVWGPGWVGDDHLVDVHVLHVRQKLGDTAKEQRFVRTVRGVGYRIGPGE
ncbi:response regulator transcription factor [Cellulomonas fimi]|uniref:Two component transcriptional regulator, winged helix family n=1 Tax=Cellulomonas fimi (strain ATCC 484 / DSM 20113 / JCM 1341 / CCUG 24087 / LMG 16345 / NBRC 15513 / NCIMB 8980 / NCTC 7547 / NRS-133) TaxID=590998 RepID=F4H0U3_CELFA|nr:response regulator transcription factor [Cellulomonas fimi]AEE46190.1 two component transcriptional regulator, winged helix family [Cellulomonas fimi ATCC 484]NNH07021.1 response regulator transcription factor [Cellulomonas fimi]VEH31993.1 Alkaline phosphatase synthesis transcriptional regulatory protein phoP [Cellulomonas fimi]